MPQGQGKETFQHIRQSCKQSVGAQGRKFLLWVETRRAHLLQLFLLSQSHQILSGGLREEVIRLSFCPAAEGSPW